jgi:two-component system, cell cycle response regulator DivK
MVGGVELELSSGYELLGAMTPAPHSCRTVLVVEDQEDNRHILTVYLEYVGYRVISAVNGADGVAAARAEHPDLILMDISMPVLDGYAALRELRSDPALRSTPVVALTAHALSTDREAVLAAGFDAYLAKPIEPRLVTMEIERIIGKPA